MGQLSWPLVLLGGITMYPPLVSGSTSVVCAIAGAAITSMAMMSASFMLAA